MLLPVPLPAPWSALTPRRQAAVHGAIRTEVSSRHRLDGLRFRPYAECDRCCAIVVELDDGRHALVRPRWSGHLERAPEPRTEWLGGPSAAAAAMRAHAQTHVEVSW